MTLSRWVRHGLVRLESPGSGRRRTYPPEELRVLRALIAATTLGGAPRWPAPGWTPAVRAFLATVAEVARSNPPGTAHEIVTPCPYVRHIVIVPEP